MKTKKIFKTFWKQKLWSKSYLVGRGFVERTAKRFSDSSQWVARNWSKTKKEIFSSNFLKRQRSQKKVRSENRFISFFCVKSEIFDGFRQKIDQKAFLNPIPRTYSLVRRQMAWLGFFYFSNLFIEHARAPFQLVWVQFFYLTLMPEWEKHHLKRQFFCWLSNPGQQRSNQVHYPLHHGLSGTKKLFLNGRASMKAQDRKDTEEAQCQWRRARTRRINFHSV